MNDVVELTPEEQEFEDLKETVALLEEYLMENPRNTVISKMYFAQKALLDAGISRLPEDPDPVEITGWDDLGFSLEVDEYGCVQFRPVYEKALELAESGDRVFEFMAHWMRRNWYMIPVPGREDEFENNSEWADVWNMAYDANTVMGVFGRSKFMNKKLYSEYGRGKNGMPISTGALVADHYVPFVGRRRKNWQAFMVAKFIERWSNEGKGLFHAYNVARSAIHAMDDNRREKWSGYKTFAESNFEGVVRRGRESSRVKDNPFAVILTPDE